MAFGKSLTIAFILGFSLINAGTIGYFADIHTTKAGTRRSDVTGYTLKDRLLKEQVKRPEDDHIVGSHIVKVIPPTIAQLNPEDSQFCVSPLQPSASLPLKIKGVPPFLVDYIRYNFDGSLTRFQNVTIGEIDKVAAAAAAVGKPRSVRDYKLSVDRPGVYRLTKIREASDVEGRIKRASWADVVPCPEAKWILPNHDKTFDGDDGGNERIFDRCVNSGLFQFGMTLSGTPPLLASVVKRVGKAESVLDVETGNADFLEATITWSDEVPEEARSRVLAIIPKKIQVPVEVDVNVVEPHFFRIVQVQDARKNTLKYDVPNRDRQALLAADATSASAPATPKRATNLQTLERGDHLLIQVHDRPSAQFSKCESIKLRLGAENSTEIPLILSGTAPWSVHFSYAENQESLDAGQYDKLFFNDIQHSRVDVSVGRPGIYALLEVHDKFCPGSVQMPKTCLVQQTSPPQVEVKSEPIEQSCVGAIGAMVDLSFTGEPPFWITYDQIHNGVRRSYRVDVPKPRHILEFKPSNPGRYDYIFTKSPKLICVHFACPQHLFPIDAIKVGDANYIHGVPIKHQITQVIHPLSRAWFDSSALRNTLCTDDSVELPVVLEGSGPWRLSYEIMYESQKTQFVMDEIAKPKVTIHTPDLKEAGTYIVVLTSITDSNGCMWPLDTEDATIEVLAQRPAIYFESVGAVPVPVSFLAGQSARLPVILSGRPPFVVSYKSKDASGKRQFRFETSKHSDALEVWSPGVYELLEIRDKFCVGNVMSPNELEAVMIPRPKLQISSKEYETSDSKGTFIRPPVCEGSQDSLEVTLTGKPPFKVRYVHEWIPNSVGGSGEGDVGKAERQVREEQVGHRVLRIPMSVDKAGVHRYHFEAIADDHYRVYRPLNVDDPDPSARAVIVQQKIRALPDAWFMDGPEKSFRCLGDVLGRRDEEGKSENPDETTDQGDDDSGPYILIALSGQPPFELHISLQHESSSRPPNIRITNVTQTPFKFRPTTMSQVGRYTLQLEQVVDGSGCRRVFDQGLFDLSSTASGPGGAGGVAGTGGQAAVAVVDPVTGMKKVTRMTVQISDVARISPVHAPEGVCRGDMLSYSLQGTAPFKVSYTFEPFDGYGSPNWKPGVSLSSLSPAGADQTTDSNGKTTNRTRMVMKTMEQEVLDPVFYLYAGATGRVTITRVCNQIGCCIRPTGLSTIIYDLPRAYVDGGEDVEEDIREGDSTIIHIAFRGEPPFSFTYSRTMLQKPNTVAPGIPDGSVGGAAGTGAGAASSGGASTGGEVSPYEESFTITDINEYHHTIETSQEGLFQVTAVYDRNCGYPRVTQDPSKANAAVG
ncbi:hypothetical protein HK102_001830 [Quaeritorhiza haematococci]|nr:hypothetical protein HK102_001830 [Quaeritorhiza haematococci]